MGSLSIVATSLTPAPRVSSATRCILMVREPQVPSQKKPKRVGAMKAPTITWRKVRPLEMRAMNMPTKGAQETHQPQ